MINKKNMKILLFLLCFIFISARKKIWLYCILKNNFLKETVRKSLVKHTIMISSGAKIDETVIFPHPQNIVIGRGVILEENCVIYQGVTLGTNDGLKKIGNEEIYNYYPLIKRNTIIYSNSVVAGSISIGSNSIIGANTFVNKSIPNNSIVKANSFTISKRKCSDI